MEIKYAIAALRISSTKQGLIGDSPEDQKKQIERHVEQVSKTLGSKIVVKKWFSFTESASGNLEIQPIQKVIKYCKENNGKIKYFFFKSIDRFTRGGSTIYGLLKMQLVKYGVELVDTYGVISQQEINTLGHLEVDYVWAKYSPSWITELLESERYKSELRDSLTRMIGAEINYVRMGYRARGAPPGYKNKKTETPHGDRVILKPHPIEAPWFIRMFELRIQGNLTDKEICKEINDLGFKTKVQKLRDPKDKRKVIGFRGGNPLTVKQLQRYIKKPIYAGINDEKWTKEKPVKCQFPGLVTIDMFNKANRGRIAIIEDGNSIRIVKGKQNALEAPRQKLNPKYAYKGEILCPICRRPLLGSASRGKSGKYFAAYHCNRGHYFRVSLEDFEKTIRVFVKKIKFKEESLVKFRKIVLEEWNKREKQTNENKSSFNEQLKRIDGELQALKEKIKALSSITAIKMIEDDMEKLQQKRTNLITKRNKKEEQVLDIEMAVNRAMYYMEHLNELLFSGTKPLRDAAMYGLLFEEKPTYEDLVNGTPKLAPIFELKGKYKSYEGQSVTLRQVSLNRF